MSGGDCAPRPRALNSSEHSCGLQESLWPKWTRLSRAVPPGPSGSPAGPPGRLALSPLSLQVAVNILNSGRFSMGSMVAGMLKKLIGG